VNGESDSSINMMSINNHQILNSNKSLNILLFIKLLPPNIIKQHYPKITYKIIDVLFSRNKSISIGVDIDNFLITNFTKEPLQKLPENKMISILVRLDFVNSNTEIFINNKKVEIPEKIFNQKTDYINYFDFKKIKFFQTFIGICSSIMLYKGSIMYEEGLPDFFSMQQMECIDYMKEKNTLKPIYLNGFYKEELFSVLVKQELKEKIEEKIISQLNFPIEDPKGENEMKEFLEQKIIAIYMPNRIILPEDQINK
jgi:hypothetical protein